MDDGACRSSLRALAEVSGAPLAALVAVWEERALAAQLRGLSADDARAAALEETRRAFAKRARRPSTGGV